MDAFLIRTGKRRAAKCGNFQLRKPLTVDMIIVG
jgi:hypothetical protein